MSLQNAKKKMSKSDSDINGYILMVDDDATIRRKIKRAVTDSKGVVGYTEEQPEMKNLIDIYASFTNLTTDEIVNRYSGIGYGEFKEDLAEVVIDGIAPVRDRFFEIRKDKVGLEKIYQAGAEKASYLANKTLRKVYKKVGFIPR